MEVSEALIRECTKRLMMSRMRLLCNNGFYGLLLMHAQMSISDEYETAWAEEGEKIVFNPEFINSISDPELDYVMVHEILHIALEHLSRMKDFERDKETFDQAADIVVNSNILRSFGGNIQSISLLAYGGEQMHKAPDGSEGWMHTAEEIYEMIYVEQGRGQDEEEEAERTEDPGDIEGTEEVKDAEGGNSGEDTDLDGGIGDSDENPGNQDDNEGDTDTDEFESSSEESDEGEPGENSSAKASGRKQNNKPGRNSKEDRDERAEKQQEEKSEEETEKSENPEESDENEDSKKSSKSGGSESQQNDSSGREGGLIKPGGAGEGLFSGKTYDPSAKQMSETQQADKSGAGGDSRKSRGSSGNSRKTSERRGWDVHIQENAEDLEDNDQNDENDLQNPGSGASRSRAKHEFWKACVLQAIEAMASRRMLTDSASCGGIPAFAERFFEELKKPQTDWRTILNEFIQEDIIDYTFTPPDRRFDDSPFFLPDFNEKDERAEKILFMIDTSGSMSDNSITIVYSEIKGAIDQFNGKLEGWLGFFDADVVEPRAFSNEDEFRIIRPKGGGGTSFAAIFKYISENMSDENIKSIVILTDGYAPFPEEKETHGTPVLWIITNEDVNPPWGKVARVKVDQEW